MKLDTELKPIKMTPLDKLKFWFTGTYSKFIDDGIYRDVEYFANDTKFIIKNCRLIHEKYYKYSRWFPFTTKNILLTKSNKIVILKSEKFNTKSDVVNEQPVICSIDNYIHDKHYSINNYLPDEIVKLLIEEKIYVPKIEEIK